MQQALKLDYLLNMNRKPRLQISYRQMSSKEMDGLKSVKTYIVLKNVGIHPLYNINKYDVKK